MKILIAGGTGFIGKHLTKSFIKNGDKVTILTRNLNIKSIIENVEMIDKLDSQNYYDCIINLSGEKINNKKWSETFKKELYDSRINPTKSITDYIENAITKPKLFLSGSAISFYGTHPDRIFTEKSLNGQNFSSKLCKDWEDIARKAVEFNVRTVFLRTGLVLGKEGGILKEMIPSFKLFLGMSIGSGKQFMSWIHIDDYIKAINYIINEPSISGPVNLVSPNPSTNQVFSETLAKALKTKMLLKMPEFVAKILFGEMAEELLINGQKVYPSKLVDADFNFSYPKLDNALNDLLN